MPRQIQHLYYDIISSNLFCFSDLYLPALTLMWTTGSSNEYLDFLNLIHVFTHILLIAIAIHDSFANQF
jgi:hypothetical protein